MVFSARANCLRRVLGPMSCLVFVASSTACGYGKTSSPETASSTSSPTAPTPTVVRPSVSSLVVLPLEVGIASVTSYAFQGSGVQGNNLSYSWDFGDGASSTGQSASHVFQLAGAYQVRLTINNSSGSATTASSVAVKNLTGRWRVVFDSGLGARGNFDIVQTGSQLAGRFFDDIGDTPNAVIEATFLSGREVQIRTLQQYANSSRVDRYIGSFNPTADKICGTYNVVSSFIMVRDGSGASLSNTCTQ